MPLKRAHGPDDANSAAPEQAEIFRSSTIKDRSSSFTAVFSPTLKAKELQALPEFKTASHRIAAWRTASSQRTISSQGKNVLTTGHDDDGEAYAGKRLEKVLVDMSVEGSAVVARWYGGILLGPVRFTHIENVAKEAIGKYKEGLARDGEVKKRKVDDERDEAREVVRLAGVLGKRDESIAVLRSLLAEKKDLGKEKVEAEKVDRATVTSPVKVKMDYRGMPLLRLKQLEKARDTTIAWLLKQIDQAEEGSKEGEGESHGGG